MPEYNKTLLDQLKAHRKHIYAVHPDMNIHVSGYDDAELFNKLITNTKAFLSDVGTELTDILDSTYNGLTYTAYRSIARHYRLYIRVTSNTVNVEFTIKNKITKEIRTPRIQGADKTEVKRLINEMRFHLI